MWMRVATVQRTDVLLLVLGLTSHVSLTLAPLKAEETETQRLNTFPRAQSKNDSAETDTQWPVKGPMLPTYPLSSFCIVHQH
jgi:hypothetical protein